MNGSMWGRLAADSTGGAGEVSPARAAAPREVGDWAEEVHGDDGRPHVPASVDEARRTGRKVGPCCCGQGELHRHCHEKHRLLAATQFTPMSCPHAAPALLLLATIAVVQLFALLRTGHRSG